VFTRVEDFSRFVIAFLNQGKIDDRPVLAPSVITTLSTPRADVPGSDQKYGYGVTLRRYRGVRLVEHGGSRAGYGSFVSMAPEHGVGVIVLINRTGAALPKTVEKVLELALPLEPKPEAAAKPTVAMTETETSGFVGVYANGESRVEIYRKDGQLHLRAANRDLPIRKIAADRFAVVAGAGREQEYAFVTGGGRVEFLHSGGRSLSRVARSP